uniref:ISXO2-like transposase domain-containing protein n=1 Tax=Ditylenchus dipsaci TaxID=166011 RepID=A0A915DCX1_9BILA
MPSAKRNERAKNKDWNDRKRARELDRAANAGVGGPGEEIALPTTGITGQQASVPNLPSGIQKAVVPNPPSRIQKAVVPNFTFITQAPERAPVRLVEIDESQFGKWKYNRGHRVDGSWVFGGISRNSGDVFMVQVEKRDKTTLLPLIRQWILPQTTIICDGWRAYNTLEEEDYEVLQSYCIVCE